MPDPIVPPEKISSDPFFWAGIFASPLLSCLFFSVGNPLGSGSGESATVIGLLLILTTLIGAFYCGFKIAFRCSVRPGIRILLGLVFTFGFFVLDFAVFFVGCCAVLSMGV